MIGKPSWVLLLAGFFCLLLLRLDDVAQTSLGDIKGLVRDSTGAVIPSVTVTLRNQDTNQSRPTISNESGLYAFPSVPAGDYLILVEHSGFNKYEGKLVLRVGQEATVNLDLEVASTSVTLEVKDPTSVVETSRSALSDVKESERIRTLPLNGRNIATLFNLSAGVSRQGLWTQVNGLEQGNVEFLADGITIEDNYLGDFTRVSPALEGVQEFKVESLNSPAQYSKPATISYLTKSGNNQLHGSGFWSIRDNALLARNPFSTQSAPDLRNRNELGASLGGPVVLPRIYDGKNKTFWFFTYEGLRLNQSQVYLKGSPTEALRGGNFSDYRPIGDPTRVYTIYDPLTTRKDPVTGKITRDPFPNNIIPAARISNLAKKALSYYPMPNIPGAPIDQNLGVSLLANTVDTKYTAKIDHQLGANDSLSGTFTFTDERRLDPHSGAATLEIYTNNVTARTVQFTFAETHIFGPRVVNEVRFGGDRPNSRKGPTIKNPAMTTVLGLQNVTGDTGWPCLYPYNPVNVDTEFGGMPQGLFWDDDNPETSPQFFGQYVDNVSITRSKHNIKTGVQFQTLAVNSDARGQPRGCYEFPAQWTGIPDANGILLPGTGSGFASFLLGYDASGQLRSDKGFFYHRQKQLGLYFQDDWKVRPRLTLNLGFRYEYYTRYRDKRDQIATYDPVTKSMVLTTPVDQAFGVNPAAVAAYEAAGAVFKTNSQVGFPDHLLEPDRNDFAPRVGFAYLLNSRGNFVIRGGFGISYWTMPLIALQAPTRQNPPFNYTRSQVNWPVDWADYLTSIPPYVLGGGTPAFSDTEVFITAPLGNNPFSPWTRDARADSWNLTLEREFWARTLLRASYVGTRGHHLQVQEPVNTAYPKSLYPDLDVQQRRSDPVYSDIQTLADYGYSISHQFQIEVKRNMGRNVIAQAFYVFQKTLNTSEQNAWPGNLQFLGDRRSGIASRDQRLALEYGNSAYYPRQQFIFNFLIDLPFGPKQHFGAGTHGVVAKMIGGWQLASISSFRTGFWFSPDQSRWRVGDGNLPTSQRTVQEWFDTSAFVLPRDASGNTVDVITGGRPGRGILMGPGLANIDFTVAKVIPVHENWKVRFTSDFFNLFNHPNYSQPATDGSISSTVTDPRVIQFGLRLDF